MKITPIDVAHKQFNKTLLGLNAEEVFSYLQEISHQLEDLIKERNLLRDSLREKELSILEFKDRDELLKTTLTTASQMAEKVREDSEKRAQLMLTEAKMKASEIEKGAHQNLKVIYAEISRLKKLRLQYEANMKAMAHAHLSLLEEGQKYLGLPSMRPQDEAALNEYAAMNESPTNTELNSTKGTASSQQTIAGISPLSVDII